METQISCRFGCNIINRRPLSLQFGEECSSFRCMTRRLNCVLPRRQRPQWCESPAATSSVACSRSNARATASTSTCTCCCSTGYMPRSEACAQKPEEACALAHLVSKEDMPPGPVHVLGAHQRAQRLEQRAACAPAAVRSGSCRASWQRCLHAESKHGALQLRDSWHAVHGKQSIDAQAAPDTSTRQYVCTASWRGCPPASHLSAR